MTSLTWTQISDSFDSPLSIPDFTEVVSSRVAAQLYAERGWYVLPILPETKHPGSVVGKDWPSKSTRDSEEIKRLFNRPDYGIALHVGKSGAIAFDVDEPKNLPLLLQQELYRPEVPFQSTRLLGDERRGHYLFRVPAGTSFGNGLGDLGKGWGDIRGVRGVTVASPSCHSEPDGFYEWKRTGLLPILPTNLAMRLTQHTADCADRLSRDEAVAFIAANNQNRFPGKLESRLNSLRENSPSANGRHQAMLLSLCDVLKDCMVGCYPAAEALNQLQAFFNHIKPASEQTPNEFENMVYWAMAQVAEMSADDKDWHAYSVAPSLNKRLLEWGNRHV